MAGNYFMGIKLEDLVNSAITLFLCKGCVLNLSQIILTFIVCFKFTWLTFVISLNFFFFVKFFIFGLIGIVCTPLSAGGRGLSKFSERGGGGGVDWISIFRGGDSLCEMLDNFWVNLFFGK